MSLADVLSKSLFPTFPYFIGPIVFSTYNLSDLANSKFSNYRSAQLRNNLKVYAGGPDDEDEIEEYVKQFSGIYFKDVNKNSTYEAEFDKKLGDIRLFISTDGAYLLEAHKSLSIQSNEIAIFLEIPEGDIFSDNILLIKAGENAQEYAKAVLNSKFINEKNQLTSDQVTKLLESLATGKSFWEQIVFTINEIEGYIKEKVTEIAINVFSEIADFFGETIRVEEKTWNAGHPDYVLGEIENDIIGFLQDKSNRIEKFISENDYLPEWAKSIIRIPKKLIDKIIKGIMDFFDKAGEIWAFICGLWNGLVDLISGIFELLKLIFQGINAYEDYKNNEEYYKSLAVEYLDNALQALLKLDWSEVIIKALTAYIELGVYIFTELPGQVWDRLSTLNKTEIQYYEGYIVFNILEFLLPPLKLAKLAKLSKVEKVVDFFEGFAVKTGKAVKLVKQEAKKVAEIFFKVIADFITILRKGTKEVVKFIDDFYAIVRKWLEETFGIGKKVARSNYDEFVEAYGKLIARGSTKLTDDFVSGLKKIDLELQSGKYLKRAKADYEKYKKVSRNKNKLSEIAYLAKHKVLAKNQKVGALLEDLVLKHLKGKKPGKSIEILKKRRYIDNFLDGTAKELKSGKISLKYKDQIDKDIALLLPPPKYIGKEVIKKIEWHTMEGIDEVTLKYIQKELTDKNISIDKFQIIFY